MALSDVQAGDNEILAALAQVLLKEPRASLQELAKAIGISRATLYRFCRTREELEARLIAHGTKLVSEAIGSAGLETLPPLEALRKLISNSLQHREITGFLTYHLGPDDDCGEYGWIQALDSFFLRGQQAGVFRIDISASELTEIWGALVVGLVDGERKGRIAKARLADLFERAFLRGVAAN